MDRQVALYLGNALLVIGAIFAFLAFRDGIFAGSTLAGCAPSAQTPFPPVSIAVHLPVIEVRVHDRCNYMTVHPWLTYGGLLALVGGIILVGERVTRARTVR